MRRSTFLPSPVAWAKCAPTWNDTAAGAPAGLPYRFRSGFSCCSGCMCVCVCACVCVYVCVCFSECAFRVCFCVSSLFCLPGSSRSHRPQCDAGPGQRPKRLRAWRHLGPRGPLQHGRRSLQPAAHAPVCTGSQRLDLVRHRQALHNRGQCEPIQPRARLGHKQLQRERLSGLRHTLVGLVDSQRIYRHRGGRGV
jgi:hypothetical protein